MTCLHIGRANYALATDSRPIPPTPTHLPVDADNPSNGCVPVNLFGFGAPSQAAINYITGTQSYRTTIRPHSAAIDIQGEPFRPGRDRCRCIRQSIANTRPLQRSERFRWLTHSSWASEAFPSREIA